jgi:dodecin
LPDFASPNARIGVRRAFVDTGAVMTIAKVIEISSSSPKSIEDAVQDGLRKVATTVKNIKSAWVNEIKVITTDDGKVQEWRINMRVNFVVE